MTRWILLPLLLAPFAAGCGSNNPTTSATAAAPQRGATAAYAYARCMRTHGVSNFPDPKVSVSPGHTSISIAVDPSITGSPSFKSADKACSGILPAPASPAEQRAEEQAHKQNLLAFARCLRTHGIHDFPDPDQQGSLHLSTLVSAGVDIHSRTFLGAATACASVTHGMITAAQIEQAVKGGTSGGQSSAGG
jgi:hypothetical protein